MKKFFKKINLFATYTEGHKLILNICTDIKGCVENQQPVCLFNKIFNSFCSSDSFSISGLKSLKIVSFAITPPLMAGLIKSL